MGAFQVEAVLRTCAGELLLIWRQSGNSHNEHESLRSVMVGMVVADG